MGSIRRDALGGMLSSRPAWPRARAWRRPLSGLAVAHRAAHASDARHRRSRSRSRSVTAIAVIDFETTGMCAGADRIIEVGAAIVQGGEVVGTFAELMDPGRRIPSFITGLTGISDAMVRGKPRPEAVMPRLRAFLGDHVCLAHNAGFDQRFFTAEMDLAGEAHERPFLCSVLLARRLVQNAPSHRLGDLARHLGLRPPAGMRAHRALADVLMTVQLWNHLRETVSERLGRREPDLTLFQTVMRMPKAKVAGYLEGLRV
jgi:DNA polymerase-3 subunit epsilon